VLKYFNFCLLDKVHPRRSGWGVSMMRGSALLVPVVRLGLVLGLALLGVVLLTQLQKPAMTTVAPIPQSQPAAPSSGGNISNVPPADEDVPRVDGALIKASAMMIPAPPEIELALQKIDPRRLRASFQRGRAAMQKYTDDEPVEEGSNNLQKIDGARLVNVAAIFGYEPARALIARDYPRSHIIRLAVSANEAVRYSLDSLFIYGAPTESNRALTFLATYYSGRHELDAFAVSIMEVLRDDRRLQTEDRIKFLLTQFARIRGACMAITRAISPARILTGAECSPALQQQMQLFIQVAAPAGREAESRRQALSILHNQGID
jgi:hypothetical protein